MFALQKLIAPFFCPNLSLLTCRHKYYTIEGVKFLLRKWGKNLRLLIVEDEKELCDTVAKTLYHAGYEIDTCYDGSEALDYILAESYDLIVLDLNLPGMDGMELLKELRKKMGMNRREFSDYYGIPYRTVQDWEAEKRELPDYLLRLLKYRAEIECRIERTGK